MPQKPTVEPAANKPYARRNRLRRIFPDRRRAPRAGLERRQGPGRRKEDRR